jgi:protein FAM32A
VARRKEAAASGAAKSHRERVDDLNEKLSTMTEHNDIPRISAAGNG